MSQFVIREKSFGYNDEFFYVAGYRIAQVFQHQSEAEQVYKSLEINAARNFSLHECAELYDASEEALQTYDDFVFSRCGQHILKEGFPISDVLPRALNDEDTFEFIQLAKMQSFQLIPYEGEVTFYGFWSAQKQDWLKEYDECFENLIYAESAELLKHKMDALMGELSEDDWIQEGSIESLTDSPAIFQAIILSNFGLKYINNALYIKEWDEEALFAINPVLKRPIFEIREISLQDVLNIEKELQQQYDEEYEA